MTDIMELLREDNATQPVAQDKRQGWVYLASVMIGCTICVPVFVMGAQFANQIIFSQFLLAAFLGGTLAAGIAALTGIVGQKSGLSTAMLVKIAFGRHGYVIANLAMTLCAIGWFGIQNTVFSRAFVDLAHQVWYLDLPLIPVTIFSGLIMSSTAVIGFRGLGKLSFVAVPLLIVMLLLPLFHYVRNETIFDITTKISNNKIGLGTMIAMIGGAYSFASTMPDVTRFMRDKRSTLIGIISNFALTYPLLLILTGVTALASGQSDYMQIMLGLGFGTLAILVLFLSTWTTNDTNVYSASIPLNLFMPNMLRWKIALGVGVLGTIFSVFGIFEHFMSWLIFTGNVFAPMAGVYVVDYFVNRKRYDQLDNIKSIRFPQICAWLFGIGIGLMVSDKTNMGFQLFSLTHVPMVDALISAATLTYLLNKFFRKKAE